MNVGKHSKILIFLLILTSFNCGKISDLLEDEGSENTEPNNTSTYISVFHPNTYETTKEYSRDEVYESFLDNFLDPGLKELFATMDRETFVLLASEPDNDNIYDVLKDFAFMKNDPELDVTAELSRTDLEIIEIPEEYVTAMSQDLKVTNRFSCVDEIIYYYFSEKPEYFFDNWNELTIGVTYQMILPYATTINGSSATDPNPQNLYELYLQTDEYNSINSTLSTEQII